jgi:hypothetical protein
MHDELLSTALAAAHAGAEIDLDGGEGSFASGNIVAGAPAVHRELLEIVRRHVSEEALERVNPVRSPAPVA